MTSTRWCITFPSQVQAVSRKTRVWIKKTRAWTCVLNSRACGIAKRGARGIQKTKSMPAARRVRRVSGALVIERFRPLEREARRTSKYVFRTWRRRVRILAGSLGADLICESIDSKKRWISHTLIDYSFTPYHSYSYSLPTLNPSIPRG